MKNDYLWDKTGKDSEIEKLENALLIFRSNEINAPEIPNDAFSLKIETPQKVFPFFRALAAGFAFASMLIVFGFVYFNSENETVKNQKTKFSIQTEVPKNQTTTDFIEPKQTNIEKASIKVDPKNNVENQKSKIENQKFKVQRLAYKTKSKASKVQKTEVVKLTEEEKEAYDKLMLALSITSSKLKIVKDKVQNLDEQTAINTENKKYTRKK